MQMITNTGEVVTIKLRPHRNKFQFRRYYHIYGCGFNEYVKALNLFNAVVKFTLKHPTIWFWIDRQGRDK